jgi:spermidine/putrescine transport system ATP-binding protein
MAAPLVVELRDVTKTFGEVTAVKNANIQIAGGEFFSLLGPSGCGKTTTLRMIAGFEQPTAGEIFLHGRSVAGIPAYQRPVNTVFQNYALFPHMTVWRNVAFGLEMKKVPKAEITRRVSEALELVQLIGMDERRPKQLSGGQQQRVALARALVNHPEVLLLDEPLGALDLKLRKAMQFELKQIQEQLGITFIYVTHDQEEALTMSDRIAVISMGEVQQIGAPREIYEHPNNRFVADFIGETNFITARVLSVAEFVTLDIDGVEVLGTADNRPLSVEQKITLAIRPEKINLYPTGEVEPQQALDLEEMAELFGSSPPEGKIDMGEFLALESNNVVVKGSVQQCIYIGTDTRYDVSICESAHLVVRMQNYGSRYDIPFKNGDDVYVHWAAENAQILTE